MQRVISQTSLPRLLACSSTALEDCCVELMSPFHMHVLLFVSVHWPLADRPTDRPTDQPHDLCSIAVKIVVLFQPINNCSTYHLLYPILIDLKESKSDEVLGDKLIGHKGNGLTRHDSKESRCDSLPQGHDSFLLGNQDTSLTQSSVLWNVENKGIV